ncbi:MAG: DUF5688 family protein [Lachnospiraceae bacterium]|nr:DUF5688 family protein [Lachnospiraceae bacterium]
MESIGERLRKMRLAAGMKQDTAAGQMNMARTTLSAIEAGRRQVLAEEIPRFAELYSRSVDEIFMGTDRKEYIGTMTDDMKTIPKLDKDALNDYSKVRNRLSMEMVETRRNAGGLRQIPHEEMEDLSVVCRIVVGMDRQSRETVLVTNEMLDHYGITRNQLMSDAKENAPQLLPASLSSISEALGIPTDPGSMDMLYVASVEGMRHGAGVLAYPGFLNDAAEKLGGDFFILPSSIHEVLLMRDEGNITARELQDIISTVNQNEVLPAERLSDHAYRYDSKEHVFELAEKFEERMRGNPERASEEGRGSVLTKLQDKKSEISAAQSARNTAGKADRARGGEAI